MEGPELDLLPLSPEHTKGNSGCPRPACSLDTAVFIPQQAWDSECLHNDYENIPKYERWSRKAREVKESDCSCHNFWSRQPVNIKCHQGRWRECRRARKVSRNYVKESEVVSDSCDPMDCSLPGSSVHGIFQVRVLEWVAISFSKESSWPRDRTWVSHIAGRHFTVWATREAPNFPVWKVVLILCNDKHELSTYYSIYHLLFG